VKLLRSLATALLLSSLGCAVARPAAVPTASSRPNLVVVLSDDHRWDALGAAGNPSVITPVMDSMVRDGVYFRQATVSVSQCHPVRASLLTGLPAHRHGVAQILKITGLDEFLTIEPQQG
jgi:arylsulfatase A-like enzyme